MSKPTMQSLKTEIDNLKDTVQELKTSLRRIENWLLAGMGSITMLLVTQMFMQEVAIDPATIGLLLTGATKAVDYLKQGLQLGKDINEMSSAVTNMITHTHDLEHMEKRAKNPTLWQQMFSSENIEKVAVETLMAKKKMQKHRQELKNLILMNYSQQTWDQLIQLEGQIRKDRIKAHHAKIERLDHIKNVVGITVLTITIVGFFVLIAFLWKMQRGV